MNVLDSSCWLEYAADSSIGQSVVPVVENNEWLIVPTITVYEVYKKLRSMRDEVYANQFVQQMRRGQIVPLDEALSIQAADISRQYKLPMADSIIYATAQQCQAVIWTADQHFEHLPQVRYFDKKQSDIESRKS
ncbi:hypothetical protein FACS189454_02860 [Planctomycetales bacterium]|nr:hypothetical protein FACS189454_02860 [Planctomycetales bacterium]